MLGIKYTIEPGDTLTEVARDILGDASKWRLLWEHNNKPSVRRMLRKPLLDPHRLWAGEYIFIPGSVADFTSGTSVVIDRRSGLRAIKRNHLPEAASGLWLGVGEAHSGDLVALGYFNWNARLYRLSARSESAIEWARVTSHGFKLGGGLGGSGGLVAVFAHGIETTSRFDRAFSWGNMDFDLALGAGLGGALKSLKGIGRVAGTMEKYKKLTYVGKELAKNKAFVEKGVYTIPVPFAETGVHVWVGRKYATMRLEKTGTGLG